MMTMAILHRAGTKWWRWTTASRSSGDTYARNAPTQERREQVADDGIESALFTCSRLAHL
jgi:hypothetical protein